MLIISDDATRKLEDQEMLQQVNHDELLSDLAFIREKAKEVWDKIGNVHALYTYRTVLFDANLLGILI